MGIKLKRWKNWLPIVIWGTIGLLLAAFFITVFVRERIYYGEKEGSERATSIVTEETETVSEEVPAEEEVVSYTVSPDKPRYLSIEKLGIQNSRVLEMGLTNGGALDTPNNVFDVGWYRASGKPGQGGTMLIDGHNGGPHVEGIFKHLDTLTPGDIIKVERGDGKVFKYSVVENYEISLDEANSKMHLMEQSPVPGKESLSLITCIGEWSLSQNTYLSRQFLRAVITE